MWARALLTGEAALSPPPKRQTQSTAPDSSVSAMKIVLRKIETLWPCHDFFTFLNTGRDKTEVAVPSRHVTSRHDTSWHGVVRASRWPSDVSDQTAPSAMGCRPSCRCARGWLMRRDGPNPPQPAEDARSCPVGSPDRAARVAFGSPSRKTRHRPMVLHGGVTQRSFAHVPQISSVSLLASEIRGRSPHRILRLAGYRRTRQGIAHSSVSFA